MKGRVKLDAHEFYNSVFDIGFLSFEMAAGQEERTGSVVAAQFEDVDFIYDAPWEEKVIKNREILNIKKPREASYYMYFILISAIEEHIKAEIDELQILSERDSLSKNMWVKKIKLAANGIPVVINISGKKYSNEFDVRTVDMERQEFVKECEEEIEKAQNGLRLYTKRINGLMYTIQLIKYDKNSNNKSNTDRMLGA